MSGQDILSGILKGNFEIQQYLTHTRKDIIFIYNVEHLRGNVKPLI